MKIQLMIQALSPLALLTIIKNFSFVTIDANNEKLTLLNFISTNLPLLIVISICVVWILLSLVFLLMFNVFKYSDKTSGYTVVNVVEKEEASLNFFLTLILPLLIDGIETWQGTLLFITIVILICLLLANTNLFYANPILTVLGYRTYEFSFSDNKEKGNQRYIALCRGEIQNKSFVEYKEITKGVLYMKGMSK